MELTLGLVLDLIRMVRNTLPKKDNVQCIWSDCSNPQDYFSPREYIIGDSALTNSNIFVTSNERASGQAVLSILGRVGLMYLDLV
jgi:hypothetical protein